jgi:serine/threonine-protein kinase ATR
MRTLLVDNFKFIFLHLVKNGQQEDLHNVSEYLKSAGGFDMTALLHSEALNVLNLLLLHLSTHRKRVLAGVKIVAGIKRSVTVETEEDIANYLHPRLHGVIAYFNFVLLRVNGSDGILKAKLAINSLVELMKLMGRKYITLVKMKVIGMLRHCLSFKDDTVVECTLSAWKCFMESVETESLGPLLGQIVVALCPFVEKYAEQVSAMFEFFIIENRDALLPYFSDIYLVPEHPALKNVRDVLCASNMVKKSLQERVRRILKGVRHERSDVRRDALKALYKLQIECRNELEWCMVGSETIDPVITEIITTLLSSLRGASDTELRGLYGKCLGELGAIDPGKLEIPSVSTVRVVMFAEIDQGFARDLLQELARAYSASSNTRTQDCCAFAIQEVLRACESNNIDSLSDGTKFWSSLPADCQEVLQPHLDSNYTASIQEPVKYTTPIFKTMKLKNFSEWIKKWCIWLIHKLKQGLPKQIFLPCTLVFQHSTSPVVYMLPYVLVCVLRCVNHGIIKQVQKEVMAVLNNMAHTKEILPEDMYSNSMCAQTIFRAIDFLTAWVVEKSKAKGKGGPHKENEDIQQVKDFINEIPKDILGLAAFKCHAYTRALMYIEMFLSANQSVLEEHLGFLQKVYVALDEPDGVAGVVAVRNSEPTMQEEIIEFESTGNYRGAAALYEQIIQENPDSISYHEGLMRCLMRQGNVTSAVMHVDGLRERKPQWVHRLNAFRVEAAWKLGQWGDLEQYLKAGSVSSKNWDVNVGYLLLAAKQKNLSGFMQRLSKVRAEQMGPLSTASYEQGSYQRGYEYIVRLHMLQELEEYVIPLISSRKKPCRHSIERWRARLSLTQESFRICEPILSLRRVMLGLEPNKHNTEIGQYWLGSTQIARSAGHIQTSESFLLKVREYALLEFNIEKAKHLRSEGASHSALLYLQKFVRKQWSENRTILEEKEQFIHAQALLLIGQWMEETAHYDTQTVLKQYKSVIDVQPKSEEGHFYLGKYYDRLMGFMAKDRPANDFLPFIIRHYGHTLEYGCKYLYQCMPRLLTLWLDFGCKVPDSGKKSQERSGAKTVQQLNDIIQTMSERLPAYQYLIAFSQLISRICHPNCNVFSMLEAIILKLIEHYPQQCLWMMVAVNKSTHHDRQERCRTILEKAKQQITGMDKLITDMVRLTDKLLEVCNKPAESGKTYSMDKICRGLTRLTTAEDFSCIMVPLQSSMTVTLPAGISDSTKHNAFPGFQPTIERFDEKVEVLPSLQKPKKITACGSDGKAYVLLCKPKDDLRKDARLMEFNSVINKCLRKHPECRQRRLHIRTYAVIPLNEECGLLEWVPNTHGLRNILIKLYQERQVCMSGRELRDAVKPAGRDAGKLKDIFLTKLLPRHPPVFGEWFLRTFPDPTAWYSSRLSYAHTAAVMSMVGYVLGLGDRHGENILFDSKSGDCVHVDFNCLFNRGETLEVAEVVPFRLTHNMIHALGATGYEGAFRKSCEITMSLMRTECDTLLCVLKTFIHDPLVEWEKVKGQPTSHDATNEKAIKIIHDTEDRLQGKYPKSKGLPLSIEGQVDGLIKDATSIDNLSKMYIGWAAFM